MRISTVQTSITGISHFFRVAAIKHFSDYLVIIFIVIAGMILLESFPVIYEYLFEGCLVDMPLFFLVLLQIVAFSCDDLISKATITWQSIKSIVNHQAGVKMCI